MSLVTRKRPKIGDVIEIETLKGLAYFQYTYKYNEPPKYGALIRILPNLYKTRPPDFSELVRDKERFFIFFPLGAACNRDIVKIVANEEIPEESRGLPMMRLSSSYRDKSGKIVEYDCRIWDGTELRNIGKLTNEYRHLSLLQVWNDTILIERIVSGWKPSDAV
jgi:hypothetical protein